MNTTSTPQARLAQYEKDGYCIVRSVLDRDLVTEAQQHVHWLLKKHPDTRPEQLHAFMAVNDPFWIRLVSDPRLLDLAAGFVGPDLALYATHYICKPPKTGQPVLWHQDGAYWPLEPMRVVTLWLAVTASTRDNGCLRVIPGTQHAELQKLRERKDVTSVLGSEYGGEVDESKAVDLELQPGDVSIHHPNIIHGSEANTSDTWRMGLTIRYIPTSTRVLLEKHGDGVPLMLMRGKAVEGINEYLPRPTYNPDEHMAFSGCDNWRAKASEVTP